MAFLTWLLMVILIGLISFLIIAGIFKVIALCFGLIFTWPYALGIWLIYILLRDIFRGGSKDK